MPLLGSPILTR